MKIRPLSETDLARIAPMDVDGKWAALRQIKEGRPPYSYKPSRLCLPDTFNLETELFGASEPTPWSQIKKRIEDLSKSADEEAANIRISKALHEFATSENIRAKSHEFFPISLSLGRKIQYWQNHYLVQKGVVRVPFVDPRQSYKLTAQGRRFVFSVMHERIRVADPDFSEVGLVIVQFKKKDDGTLLPILHTDENIKLFSFDELDDMVTETYSIWKAVLEEREAEARKKAGGGSLL